MTMNSAYLTAQAEACARDAEKATLDNVRERCLRAERSWRAMAERQERAEAMRVRLTAEKAARDDAL